MGSIKGESLRLAGGATPNGMLVPWVSAERLVPCLSRSTGACRRSLHHRVP